MNLLRKMYTLYGKKIKNLLFNTMKEKLSSTTLLTLSNFVSTFEIECEEE